eukprot:6218411-Alexandrium_andersonii.AAC.1
MSASLVGSEMCIRDSLLDAPAATLSMGAGALVPGVLALPAERAAQLASSRCELWPNAHAA